jgi:inner membrane protein
VGVGSVFIIDPLYTVPLIVGVVAALWLRGRDPARAMRWNAAGLALSTLYLGWGVAAQSHVEGVVHRTLAATPLADARALVTPTPFNTLLWRVVVMDDDGYHEGYYSLFDESPQVRLTRHASDTQLLEPLRNDWAVRRLAWFSKGFYGVSEAPADARIADGSASTLGQLLGLVKTAAAVDAVPDADGVPVVMTDLRMGQTPWFVFSFVIGEREGERVSAVPSRQVPSQRPPATVLPWLWSRIWDENA